MTNSEYKQLLATTNKQLAETQAKLAFLEDQQHAVAEEIAAHRMEVLQLRQAVVSTQFMLDVKAIEQEAKALIATMH